LGITAYLTGILKHAGVVNTCGNVWFQQTVDSEG
jgi:hypothetical protein